MSDDKKLSRRSLFGVGAAAAAATAFNWSDFAQAADKKTKNRSVLHPMENTRRFP